MPASLTSDSYKAPPLAEGSGDPQADADRLLDEVRQIEAQETAAPFNAPTEEAYNAALAEIVEEKQEQANQIEDRLENMVEAQGARLQQVQSQPPGMLALPGTRAKWQAQVAQAQATMQRLQSRLETVREIKDGIHVQGTRIEALAAQKLAHREPQLSDDFAEMQEARRLHELHERQQKKNESQHQGLTLDEAPRSAGHSAARGLSLGRDTGRA